MELQQDNLANNWTTTKSGKQYFTCHHSKYGSNDETRAKNRFHGTPLHVATGEYIPLQHGSPDLRRNSVYPSQPSPIPAFQMPGQYSPKFLPLQEMRSGAHMSPMSMRTAKMQDSSFMNSMDPDEAVIKIGSMFPTVSDTHIRLLLKKYHNREAIVISALQVEKHPIATPGPFATPPPTRNVHIPLQMTPPLGVRTASRNSSPTLRTTSTNSTYTGSPRFGEAYRHSPRPHSSPKLKLRYMKSIFPQAEETIILDVLANNDNNIQKASDNLKEMGFSRKDTVKSSKEVQDNKIKEEKKRAKELEEKEKKAKTPVSTPCVKSKKEKEDLKSKLEKCYLDIPEHIINIALESVHYDETRANQILEIMVAEDIKLKKEEEETVLVITEKQDDEVDNLSAPTIVTTSQSRQSLKSLLKEKSENNNKTVFSRVLEENMSNNFKSPNLSNTNGSNPTYVNGANEKLLLEDYVKWQGPDPNIRSGANKSLAKGANKELLAKKNYKPMGPNHKNRKGPVFGLAKGSIFSQLKETLFGEFRGK